MRWEVYPGLSEWAQDSPKSPYKREAERHSRERGVKKLLSASFEDRGRGHEPENEGILENVEKVPVLPIIPGLQSSKTDFGLLTSRIRKKQVNIVLSHYFGNLLQQ